MQLTNIARDIGDDARMGRLNIPRAWFREIGMDADAWLANPVFDSRIAGFTQRLLLRADALYRRGEFGLAELPWDCRPAIQAARLVYAEIGKQLERAGLNSINHRTVVSTAPQTGSFSTRCHCGSEAARIARCHTQPRSCYPLLGGHCEHRTQFLDL
jgi:phytoene/squalene synthetase